MFQDGSDRRPADSPQTLSVSACGTESPSSRSRRTLSTVFTSRTTNTGARRTRRGGQQNVPRSVDGPMPTRAITPRDGEHANAPALGHLLSRLEAANEPVVALNPRKGHPTHARSPPCRSARIRTRRRRTHDWLNSAGRLCGPIRLPLNGFTYC